MQLIEALVKKVRGIVKGFRRSGKARKQLAAQQKAFGLKQAALVIDVVTRWNRSALRCSL